MLSVLDALCLARVEIYALYRYLHYWEPTEQVYTIWLFETVDEVIISFDHIMEPVQVKE